jgi:hypothetical protein
MLQRLGLQELQVSIAPSNRIPAAANASMLGVWIVG